MKSRFGELLYLMAFWLIVLGGSAALFLLATCASWSN